MKTIAKRINTVANGNSIATRIEVCFGRDLVQSLLAHLSPASIVVIASEQRWWPAKEVRWAKKLRQHGHHVVFVREQPSKL